MPGHPGHEQRRRERQPQRRRDQVRAGRQALPVHGRPGPPRLAAEPAERPLPHRPPASTTRSAGRRPTTPTSSGVILRLNEDGTTPADNPFFAAGAAMGGEVGANIQKIYLLRPPQRLRHGLRPGLRRSLGDRERRRRLQRAQPRHPGHERRLDPARRARSAGVADFKFIETTQFGSALQQVRYPPTRVAYTARAGAVADVHAARRRLRRSRVQLEVRDRPGGHDVRVAATRSARSTTARSGSARRAASSRSAATAAASTACKLTPDRLHVDVSADPRLADRVADNLFRAQKFDGTESETLQIGTGFGTTTEHRARARRQPLRRLDHRQRDLQDQPAGAVTRGRGRSGAGDRAGAASSVSATTRATRRGRG